jgi:hypothetical protein
LSSEVVDLFPAMRNDIDVIGMYSHSGFALRGTYGLVVNTALQNGSTEIVFLTDPDLVEWSLR